MVLPKFFQNMIQGEEDNIGAEEELLMQSILSGNQMTTEQEDDLMVQQMSNDPIIQKACKSVVSESRDIVEYFNGNLEQLDIGPKVEACIKNRCSELMELSEKLRDIEERKRISPTIREA